MLRMCFVLTSVCNIHWQDIEAYSRSGERPVWWPLLFADDLLPLAELDHIIVCVYLSSSLMGKDVPINCGLSSCFSGRGSGSYSHVRAKYEIMRLTLSLVQWPQTLSQTLVMNIVHNHKGCFFWCWPVCVLRKVKEIMQFQFLCKMIKRHCRSNQSHPLWNYWLATGVV